MRVHRVRIRRDGARREAVEHTESVRGWHAKQKVCCLVLIAEDAVAWWLVSWDSSLSRTGLVIVVGSTVLGASSTFSLASSSFIVALTFSWLSVDLLWILAFSRIVLTCS